VSHLDPDLLVLIALGEQTPGPVEADHLQDCAACRDELAATREVADLGRHTEELRELPVPSEALWQRIAAQAFAPGTAGGGARVPAPVRPPGAGTPAGPSRSGGPAGRRAGRRYGRLWLAAVAVAALVLGVAGTVVVTRLATKDTTRVIASAELTPATAAAAGARGRVELVDTGQGLQLRLSVTGMPTPVGYYAVWLYDGDKNMIDVGSLGPAPLNVPTVAQDLDVFRIVDISAQRVGQQEHGQSMLRGTLTQ